MKSSLNIIAVIPSRYGSTRLHAKPLIDLCGKPMVQHVYERAKQAKLVTKVIVATDHDEIASVVRKFGGDVVMTPESIRSGSDRIAYVAKTLPDADIVVNVQGDEPVIVPQMIDEAIKPLTLDASIQCGTLVKKITSADEMVSPGVVKVVLDADGYGIYFSRSAIPHVRDGGNVNQWHTMHQFYKHIGLYVFRKDFLLKFSSWQESELEQIEKLEQLRILYHGYKIKTTVTTYDSIPVDTAEDAERVRIILQQSV